ncbi:MAG: AMP-dependent synthetase/ligase [Myxococcota bacterium]
MSAPLATPELKPVPRYVFDRLPERRARARFMVPISSGGWHPVTWQAFADQIRHLALFLAGEGLSSAEAVAFLGPNRVEWMSAALGVQSAGGAVVPIYPASTAEQIAYIVEHSDAKLLFVDTEALLERVFERWSAYPHVRRVVCLDDRLSPMEIAARVNARGGQAPDPSEIERKFVSWSKAVSLGESRLREDAGAFDALLGKLSLDQTAVMIYTSGTTGNPKGVPLTHRNYCTNAVDWISAFSTVLKEDVVDLFWLPTSHIFGFGELVNGNILGWTSYLATPKDALSVMPEVKPEVFMSVPAYWEKLATTALSDDPATQKAKLLQATGGRLSFCLSGGAGLKARVKEIFRDAGILILEGYGLTETSPTLTLNRPDDYRFDSVGKAVASVRIRLAADGEIWAKGPNVFHGYHKDPAATREVFSEDGWFKTGDIGRFTPDGFLQIIDRKKEILVTSGGKNVPPANIELRFKDDPVVAQLVVFGDGRPYLVAGVWLNPEGLRAKLDADEVPEPKRAEATRALIQSKINAVNAELASFETVKRFFLIDQPLTIEGGFLTPTLKLRRKKVYEAYRPEFEALYG